MPGNIKVNSAIDQSLGLSGEAIYLTALQLLKRQVSAGPILDFGAGQGRMIGFLASQGYSRISAADLMPKPHGLLSEVDWVQTDLNHKLPLNDGVFASIIAIEVIEHLENPRSTVREWKRLLQPGGLLIFSTPNCTSFRSILALLLKGHFVSFLEKDYPAHITSLVRTDLYRILDENNFTDIQFHYTNKGLIPGMKGLSWQQISMGLLKGERFSDNIFATARSR